MLEIAFGNASKIMVNSQAAAREIWFTAKSGGYRFRGNDELWVDTRGGTEPFSAPSVFVGQQAGETVNLALGKV